MKLLSSSEIVACLTWTVGYEFGVKTYDRKLNHDFSCRSNSEIVIRLIGAGLLDAYMHSFQVIIKLNSPGSPLSQTFSEVYG